MNDNWQKTDTYRPITKPVIVQPDLSQGYNYRVFSLTWPASMQIYWNKRKELNSHRTGLGHQHGRRFIVLGHQYGCRDVTWKHSIRTLTRLAQLVCNSPDSLQDETDYLNNVFSKNNYSRDFVRRNTQSKTDSNTQTNVNSGPVTTATILYIRGTSETIARILQPYNIHVAQKPITTLRRLLTYVKDRQGEVYKIKCCDC